MSRAPFDADRLVREADVHLSTRHYQEAERCLREVLTHSPRHPGALHKLGVIAFSAGHPVDAERLIRDAVSLSPDNAAAWVNLGLALNALGRFAEAVDAQSSALALVPDLESAHINQASPLQALGRIDEAVSVLERALELNADRAETWNNLGNVYKEQGRVDEALQAYDRALALNPLMQEALSNRLSTMKLCDDITPEENLNWHRRWSGWHEAVQRDYVPLAAVADPERRLRIAYLSPDCHTAVPAFIRPVWRHHDRSMFEVFVYFNNPRSANDASLPAPGQLRIMAGRPDEDIARMIRDDRIDVLIDLAGHTGRNRLGVIARQPAPVQMTWLDYLGTTGLAAMHWRITDAIADPPGQTESDHSEQLIRMPDTQWCWEPPTGVSNPAPLVTELPATTQGHLTFGSFNNYSKLTDTTLRVWRDLLLAIPDAKLLVAGAPEGRARERLLSAMEPVRDRIRFAPRVAEHEYRSLIGTVDIALDPTPFSGATTTLDALWQGVPVATFGGPFPWSRSTSSLLACLHLDDWVYASGDACIRGLQQRAADLSGLAHLRSGLRERVSRSAITDAARFTAALEANIRKAWRAWCMAQQVETPIALSNWDGGFASLRQLNAGGDGTQAIKLARDLYDVRPSCIQLHAELVRAALASVPKPVMLDEAPRTERQSISFVICSIRPEKLAAIRSRIEHLFQAHDTEVIGLTDARSLAEAYNRGADQSQGKWLVFCHDDIALPQDDFADRLFAHLAAHDLVGMAGASKLVDGHWERAGYPHLHGQILHRAPDNQGWVYYCAGLQAPVMSGLTALDGVFLACRRELWADLKFDAGTYDGFHLYDIDFSHRAARSGARLAVPSDLLLVHDSTGRYDVVWQRFNQRFLSKFPDQRGIPPAHRNSSLNVKLATLDQVLRLREALLSLQFGSSPSGRPSDGAVID